MDSDASGQLGKRKRDGAEDVVMAGDEEVDEDGFVIVEPDAKIAAQECAPSTAAAAAAAGAMETDEADGTAAGDLDAAPMVTPAVNGYFNADDRRMFDDAAQKGALPLVRDPQTNQMRPARLDSRADVMALAATRPVYVRRSHESATPMGAAHQELQTAAPRLGRNARRRQRIRELVETELDPAAAAANGGGSDNDSVMADDSGGGSSSSSSSGGENKPVVMFSEQFEFAPRGADTLYGLDYKTLPFAGRLNEGYFPLQPYHFRPMMDRNNESVTARLFSLPLEPCPVFTSMLFLLLTGSKQRMTMNSFDVLSYYMHVFQYSLSLGDVCLSSEAVYKDKLDDAQRSRVNALLAASNGGGGGEDGATAAAAGERAWRCFTPEAESERQAAPSLEGDAALAELFLNCRERIVQDHFSWTHDDWSSSFNSALRPLVENIGSAVAADQQQQQQAVVAMPTRDVADEIGTLNYHATVRLQQIYELGIMRCYADIISNPGWRTWLFTRGDRPSLSEDVDVDVRNAVFKTRTRLAEWRERQRADMERERREAAGNRRRSADDVHADENSVQAQHGAIEQKRGDLDPEFALTCRYYMHLTQTVW